MDEEYDFDDNDFDDRDKFNEDILRMLKRGSPNDVKINLSDGEILANKDILMARSEYFSTMFSNNKFIEGETGSVDMTHCSKDVMEEIIKYLFSGVAMFRDLSLVQLVELSHLSKMMLLSEFQEKVDEYVQNDAIRDIDDTTDLFSALKCANQYNLENMESCLIEETIYWIKEMTSDDDSFTSLPFNLIRAIFLFDVISSNVPQYEQPTTKQRLDSFIIWLSENEVTEEQKDELVRSLIFEDFDVEELLTSVRNSGLYTVSKIDERVLVLVKEQDELVKEQKNLLQEKDNAIKEKDNSLKEKDKCIKSKDIKHKEVLNFAENQIKNRDRIISNHEQEIQRLRSRIK